MGIHCHLFKMRFLPFFLFFFQFCRIGGALVAESRNTFGWCWRQHRLEGGMLGKPTSTHPNEELSWGIYSTNQHAQSTASTDCSFCCCRIVYANHKTFLLVTTTVSHSNLHTYFDIKSQKGRLKKERFSWNWWTKQQTQNLVAAWSINGAIFRSLLLYSFGLKDWRSFWTSKIWNFSENCNCFILASHSQLGIDKKYTTKEWNKTMITAILDQTMTSILWSFFCCST